MQSPLAERSTGTVTRGADREFPARGPGRLASMPMDVSSLLAAHPVIDGHNDLLWTAREATSYDFDRLDVGAGGTPTHTDLPRMRAGGMGAQFWSVYVPTRLTGDDAVSATLEQVDAARLLTDTVRRPAGVGDHRRRGRAGVGRRPDGVPDGSRGRPLDQLLARHAATAPRPRGPLPDADPQREHPVGRLGDRPAGGRRAHRLRPRGRRGDEPRRHDGRPLPRLGRHDARRPGRGRGARDLQPQLGPRGHRQPAQRPRRRARAAGSTAAGSAWSPSSPSS